MAMLSKRVSFRLLKVGSCYHPECVAIRGGHWQNKEFPSLCALIGHPDQGWMLYDTGYSDRFTAATQSFPERLYRAITPVTLPESECLLQQLANIGIQKEDIHHILISHFHGDHISGLRDFPSSHFISMRSDWETARQLSRWKGVINGFLPALLPPDFSNRLCFAEDSPSINFPAWLHPFQNGLDLFKDGSLIALPLPGHSQTQMGLVLKDLHDQVRILTADACWSLPACKAGMLPSFLASILFADKIKYIETFFSIREIAIRESELSLFPSHCLDTWLKWERQNA